MFVPTPQMDIINSRGEGGGIMGAALRQVHFDPGYYRPYFDSKGVPCIDVIVGAKYSNEAKRYVPIKKKRPIGRVMANGQYSPVFHATSLRKNEWEELDRVVVEAAKGRVQAWSDLLGSNQYGGFNAMAKTLLEHETGTYIGDAMVDMDALGEARNDDSKYQLEGLPLPITHVDFKVSERKRAASTNSGEPLDTRQARQAGEKIGEAVEKTTIGVLTGITYGDSTNYGRTSAVYGYTNFPSRVTKTNFTAPTAGGWTPDTAVSEVLALIQSLKNAYFNGPYMVYHSRDWAQYMDGDYYALATSGMAAPTQTLRQRLRQISQVRDVKELDFLTSTFTILIVQMTADVARAINGMDITTMQWDSKGGLQHNFKVMCIQVPQLRADYYGSCGIGHGTTA